MTNAVAGTEPFVHALAKEVYPLTLYTERLRPKSAAVHDAHQSAARQDFPPVHRHNDLPVRVIVPPLLMAATLGYFHKPIQ
ncbi:MAG: hypothetical protein AUJ92_01940 [Armatimonadetes bacterium CG2_30_59_28]|nr:MAG: hypothetical protein AUJ92_01940 [Armatimonadetes bacterium CG2_30_59_28]